MFLANDLDTIRRMKADPDVLGQQVRLNGTSYTVIGVAPNLFYGTGIPASILVLRCIDNDEAWASIDAGVLVLIFSMLIVGTGLQHSGAIALIVEVGLVIDLGLGLVV